MKSLIATIGIVSITIGLFVYSKITGKGMDWEWLEDEENIYS